MSYIENDEFGKWECEDLPNGGKKRKLIIGTETQLWKDRLQPIPPVPAKTFDEQVEEKVLKMRQEGKI